MKRNRIMTIGLIMMLVTGLTGCGSQIPDMTEAQRTAISEYAVNLLLKYDTNSASRLVDLNELDEEPEASKPSKPVTTETPAENAGMDETEDTPVIDLSEEASATDSYMKRALGLNDDISIEYVDYQVMDEYADPAGDELVIEATEGKKLLVCNFVLLNDGADKQSVDMLRESIQYILKADDEYVNCLVTMLSNDLTTYLGILDSDEARKVVVIAECEENWIMNASELYVEVHREGAQAMIQVK